jgi:hypothetical protein
VKVAVYADGPQSLATRPVVGWERRVAGQHANLTAIVAGPDGRAAAARDLPHFAVVVEEEQVGEPWVERLARAVWRGRE